MNFDRYITDDILFKKDIDWNISGAFNHDDLLMTFINSLKKFGIEKSISTVHGCPPVLWNAGRMTQPMTKQEIISIIDRYAENDIKVYLTFSNALIRGKYLNDKESNFLLDKIAEQKDNGVIIASDELSKYIRDKYPHLTQVASVVKSDLQYPQKRNKDYYDNLSERFDRVVINPGDTLNFSLLNSLKNKDKVEIMLNSNCTLGCKFRRWHQYIPLAKFITKNIFLSGADHLFSQANCIHRDLEKVHYGEINYARNRNLHFTINEVNTLYNMGFRYFKLQGRTDHKSYFLSYLCRYILKEDIAPLVFKSVYHAINSQKNS